ncbi:hypothetical protein SAMN03159444_01911 [Pseudomonas sp. NFACC02]|uniref:hypothetical protein n=1 Tax=Pseudomonas sp. NFACC02 TaxID=1566250 RepID=UPI0008B63005|nr:hypothetical protein [Pseudomonas sp. NFACC02]SEQ54741.1 hypothetical protein SAMN03159444_01911 [Pseudomonas sp. NFACC02]
MITPKLLANILESFQEKLSLCGQLVSARQCDWDCCKYTDSYILFLPGELESARALGFDTSQYNILDDQYFGGAKAVPYTMGCCVDQTLSTNAYKSLDCRLFPYWFQIENNRLLMIEGLSCPIVRNGIPIEGLRREALRIAEILSDDPDIYAFLNAGRMINYRTVTRLVPVLD